MRVSSRAARRASPRLSSTAANGTTRRRRSAHSAVHDWTSHPADAFRYLALAYRAPPRAPRRRSRNKRLAFIPPPPEPRRGGIVL